MSKSSELLKKIQNTSTYDTSWDNNQQKQSSSKWSAFTKALKSTYNPTPEQFSKMSTSSQLGTKQFWEQVPKTIYQGIAGPAAKATATLKETPGIIGQAISGKEPTSEKTTYKLPGLQPFQSYLSEAETRAGDIVVGKEWTNPLTGNKEPKPLYTAWAPFIELPLTFYSMGQTAKGLFGDVTLTGPNAGKKTIGFIPKYIAQKNLEKEFKDSMKVTMEEALTSGEKKSAMSRGTEPGGIIREGLKQKIGKNPTDQDWETAGSSTGIVRSSNTPEKNVQLLQNEVQNVSEKNIKPFLEKNSYYLGKEGLLDLESRLMSAPEPTMIYTEQTLAGAKNNVTNFIVKNIAADGVDDTASLWESLKSTDRKFFSQFGSKGFETDRMNAVKSLYLNDRKIVQDFIVENTPAATDEFRYYIEFIHNLKVGQANIVEKNWAIVGTDIIKRVFSKIPLIKKILP